MAREILVLVEHAGGKVDSVTLQLLTAGRQLATQLNTGLAALVIGHQLDGVVNALEDSGADKILQVDDPALASAAGEAQAQVIAQVARQTEARFLLIGYSLVGMELTPAIATLLEINAFTNCVHVEMREGSVTVTRPLFDGTQHAHIALDENESAVIALQKGAFAPLEPSTKEAAVETVAIDSKNLPSRSKVLAIIEEPAGDVDIGKAEIIVSIGRGVGNEDKIPIVAELAEALGGVLACSRPVVDVGWLPRERQVGASGKTVTPKVYLACGISGAIQHLTGMRDSHRIIAINKDPNAPIFGVAHIGVVGDLFEIVPALTKAARDANQS
ncbi:MAG TPA: electron transfer flavoprotein subunit alpha/FixB family protein [Candidatus Binatia bacterium]|nr:electron transfer flavoprotein subunit alpha/FixB family protein [Candidatus Binatia bacterium]